MSIIKIGNTTENPLLSVVIPTNERPDDLRICLNSLSTEVQLDAPTYEIIVSDDSLSDSSRILIEKIFLLFIGEKEKRLDLQEIEMLVLTGQKVNGSYFWMMIVLLKKVTWQPMPVR